jgi:hypothetical protein
MIGKKKKKKGQGILMFEVLGVNLKYNAPQRIFFFFLKQQLYL